MTSPKTVFISGWGAGEETWRPVIDLMGGGKTVRHLPWQHCLAAEPEKNALFKILAREPAPAMLVGWSLGALLALRAAICLPEKISAMLLLAPTASMTAPDEHRGADRKTLRAMERRLWLDREGVLREFAEICIAPRVDKAFISAYASKATAITTAELAAGLRFLGDTDLRQDLSAIKTPAIILHGGEDRVIPPASGKYLAAEMPGATFESFPGEGHALPYTVPRRIAELLRSMRDAHGFKQT